jgi:hypothetical protein
VFKCADWDCTEPFTEHVEDKVIVDADDYFDLNKEQHEALCRAAEEVGDEHLFFSVLCCFENADAMSRLTWQAPLFDYDAVYEQTLMDIPRQERGIPLHRVAYSPGGKWGAWMPELYALVGGTAAFMDGFKQEYPDWTEDTHEFVRSFQEAARLRNVDISWIEPLLRHIYGDAASRFLEIDSA